jgi:hypothetical protein
MKKIKFALVGISILYASFAWSATSYAGMMGGMHDGSNGHHGGYDGYDGHHGGGYDNHHGDGSVHGGGYDDRHGGYADDPGPGWGRGRDNRSRDEHFGDAGANHGPDRDDAIDDAPADRGQRHQGP